MDNSNLASVNVMGGATGGNVGANRMSAKGVIEHRIEMLKHEIEGLEALRQVCEWTMPVAEAALWRVLTNQR